MIADKVIDIIEDTAFLAIVYFIIHRSIKAREKEGY
jgi:hypothetical protein